LFVTFQIFSDRYFSNLTFQAIEIDTKLSGDIGDMNVKACTMPITIDNLEQHLKRTKLNYPSVNGHKNGSDTKSKKER
jgi:hypothetical protein